MAKVGIDQAGWRTICLSFFKDGDPVAKEVVAYFDHSQAGLPESHVITMDPELSVEALQLISSVGMLHISDITPSDLMLCVSSKNEARREAHAILELERRSRLRELLHKHSLVAPTAQATRTVAVDSMMVSLCRFARTYSADPAVLPFVRGLTQLMAQQVGHPTVLRWILPCETFTERAYPIFMDDAVSLLCGNFNFIHDTGETGSCGWDIERSLSDRHLSRILTKIRGIAPIAFKTPSGISGTLVSTDVPRTNQEGEFDEEDDSVCPSCTLL
jgi:hypothetical protein